VITGLVLVVLGAVGAVVGGSSPSTGRVGAQRPGAVVLSGAGEDVADYPIERADRMGDVLVVWQARQGRAYVLRSAWRSGSGRWTTETVVGGVGSQYDVGLGAGGQAVAVWTQTVRRGEVVVRASTREPGGGWAPGRTISATSGVSGEPRVAVDAHGDAVAAWTESPNYLSQRPAVQAAMLVGGGWGPAQTISPVGRETGSSPGVAINARGDAIVTWRGVITSRGYVRFRLIAVSRRVGAPWSAPQGVADSAYDGQVGIDDAGHALSVFSVSPPHRPQTLQAARLTVGGAWSRPVVLLGLGGYKPALAVSPDGRAVAAWTATGELSPSARRRHGLPGGTVQASIFQPGGGWSSPVRIPARYAYGDEASAAADAHGDLAVGWRSLASPGVSVSHPGGRWTRPHLVSTSHAAGNGPALALTPSGTPITTWAAPAGILAAAG